MNSKTGILYIVATPIGNLGDISDRAREILSQVSLILAEDTRHSAKLLSACGISTPTRAYHDHNERAQAMAIVSLLQSGAEIALISDAGTPLISDPGFRLVREARQHGITYHCARTERADSGPERIRAAYRPLLFRGVSSGPEKPARCRLAETGWRAAHPGFL